MTEGVLYYTGSTTLGGFSKTGSAVQREAMVCHVRTSACSQDCDLSNLRLDRPPRHKGWSLLPKLGLKTETDLFLIKTNILLYAPKKTEVMSHKQW